MFYNIHNSTPGRVGFIRAHGDKGWLAPDIFKYHRAIAYCDIGLIERMYGFQPGIARIRGVLNFLPADRQEAFARAPFRWLGRLRRNLSYEFKDRETRSVFRNHRVFARQWPAYVEQSDGWFDTDLDALSLQELRAHLGEVRAAMARVGPPCGIAVMSHATDLHLLLTGLLGRWCARLGAGVDYMQTDQRSLGRPRPCARAKRSGTSACACARSDPTSPAAPPGKRRRRAWLA